jgi:hypothetical protein
MKDSQWCLKILTRFFVAFLTITSLCLLSACAPSFQQEQTLRVQKYYRVGAYKPVVKLLMPRAERVALDDNEPISKRLARERFMSIRTGLVSKNFYESIEGQSANAKVPGNGGTMPQAGMGASAGLAELDSEELSENEQELPVAEDLMVEDRINRLLAEVNKTEFTKDVSEKLTPDFDSSEPEVAKEDLIFEKPDNTIPARPPITLAKFSSSSLRADSDSARSETAYESELLVANAYAESRQGSFVNKRISPLMATLVIGLSLAIFLCTAYIVSYYRDDLRIKRAPKFPQFTNP